MLTPSYDIRHSDTGAVITGVLREDIGTASWASVEELTYGQRQELWNITTGFTFDYQGQTDYENSNYQARFLRQVTLRDIEGGGFSTELSTVSSAFDRQMSALKGARWIDSQTRAVEVAFNMYNANYDLFTMCVARFEFSPGGYVNADHTIRVMRSNDSWRNTDITRIVMETLALIIIFVNYTVIICQSCVKFMQDPDDAEAALADPYNTTALQQRQSQLNRGKGQKSSSQIVKKCCFGISTRFSRCCDNLLRFWNFVELLLVVILVVDYVLRRECQRRVPSLDSSAIFGDHYYPLGTFAAQYQTSLNLSVLIMFLSVFKCFKYFALNPSISLVGRVLSNAAQSFITYSFMFTLVLTGFTITGYVIFGPADQDFVTMGGAYNQLILMVVGNFDYSKMDRANAWMAPVYFISAAIMGYFILRNLFVAIINDEFRVVATDVRLNGFHWLESYDASSRDTSKAARKIANMLDSETSRDAGRKRGPLPRNRLK